MKRNLIYLFASILLVGCNSSESAIIDQKKSSDFLSVISPILGVETNERVFSVSADQADTIRLSNGGYVIFEANSFADEKGNLLKGKVDVQWNEFHSLADIMLSGIPMKYDSAGVAFDFVSGGMFSISASQGDEKVVLADGKEALVSIVSIQETPSYNFYSLDEQKGDWEYLTTASGETTEVEASKESKKEKANYSIIDADVDLRKFPSLNPKEIVGWKTNRKLSKKESNFVQDAGTLSRLIETDSLGLTLECKLEGQRKSFHVEPYTLEMAKVDSKKNAVELHDATADIVEYQANLAAGKLVRTIAIENFGTYNWDYVHTRENSKRLVAKFDFPKEVNPKLVSLFLISPDENVVIKYDAAGDDKFSFDPELRNCIVGILPNNELVSVSNAGFTGARAARDRTIHKFKMKETGIKLKSAADIMNHLEALI